MQGNRKHPIQRIITREIHKSHQNKELAAEVKQNKGVGIVRIRRETSHVPLCIQTSKSEVSIRSKERPEILPQLMTSANKRRPITKSTFKNNIYADLYITTKSWCLYDSQSNKYLGFRQDYRREIASLTKIMTTFLAIQLIQLFQVPLECLVKVTKNASEAGGTSAELPENHWISVIDLLYGTMLPSGNDAAYTLAEYFGYLIHLYQKKTKFVPEGPLYKRLDLTNINTNNYVQLFISEMNDKASKLALYSTRFSNPHGLQNALNTSSAKDITRLSQSATKNPLFSKIMNTHYYKYQLFVGQTCQLNGIRRWWNTNKLLQKGWSGVKTGHTATAGSCLCSLKNGIFITVLNSENADARFSDTEKIYDWYKAHDFKQKSERKLSNVELIRESYSKVFENRLPFMVTEITLQ